MNDLLKKSGYSQKAIDYYTNKVNVGKMEDASVGVSYTGDCGDTIKLYLKIDNEMIIRDAKFEAIGCAGAFSACSALTEMIIGLKITQARKIREDDIIDHLEGVPAHKTDCTKLARRCFEKTIHKFLHQNN